MNLSSEQVIIVLLSLLFGATIIPWVLVIPEVISMRKMMAKTIKFFLEEYARKEYGKEIDHED